MNGLQERVARAMFEEDETDRHVTTKIERMSWDKVGRVYQDRWRRRAEVALSVINRRKRRR